MNRDKSAQVLSLLYRNSDSLLAVGTILRGLAAIAAAGPIDQSTLQDCVTRHRTRADQVATAFREKRENGSSSRRRKSL